MKAKKKKKPKYEKIYMFRPKRMLLKKNFINGFKLNMLNVPHSAFKLIFSVKMSVLNFDKFIIPPPQLLIPISILRVNIVIGTHF